MVGRISDFVALDDDFTHVLVASASGGVWKSTNAGTEFSVYFSFNGGESWTDLSLNMPTAAFHDLVIHPRENDLIAGTHGRGIWILDDISPLQEMTDDIKSQNAHLFENNRPGTYAVKLSAGDQSFTGEIKVRRDPMLNR
ncbi:MAG: hypothetical protein R6V02_05265 [Candidatus Aminicenantes bacterium]